jgi:hypothetical protein
MKARDISSDHESYIIGSPSKMPFEKNNHVWWFNLCTSSIWLCFFSCFLSRSCVFLKVKWGGLDHRKKTSGLPARHWRTSRGRDLWQAEMMGRWPRMGFYHGLSIKSVDLTRRNWYLIRRNPKMGDGPAIYGQLFMRKKDWNTWTKNHEMLKTVCANKKL